jgi:hypothetical protein
MASAPGLLGRPGVRVWAVDDLRALVAANRTGLSSRTADEAPRPPVRKVIRGSFDERRITWENTRGDQLSNLGAKVFAERNRTARPIHWSYTTKHLMARMGRRHRLAAS